MVVDKTIYHSRHGNRKQIKMPRFLADAISGNDNLTKGLVVYEALMMSHLDDFQDTLSETEQRVYEELESETGEDIESELHDMILSESGFARNELVEKCSYADPEDPVDTPATVYLIPSVEENLPGRGLADPVEDAVRYVAASPWDNRFERPHDLEDLLNYARSGSVSDPSKFVDSVISGESNKYDVQTLHECFEFEWWQSSDLTLDDLMNRADDVPEKPESRSHALQIALANTDESYTSEEVANIAQNVYGCIDQTAKNYAQKVDMEVVSSGFLLDASDVISRIADDLRQNDKIKKKLTSDDYKLLNIDREVVDEVDGEYSDAFESAIAISTLQKHLNENKYTPGNPWYLIEGQDILSEWLNEQEKQSTGYFSPE